MITKFRSLVPSLREYDRFTRAELPQNFRNSPDLTRKCAARTTSAGISPISGWENSCKVHCGLPKVIFRAEPSSIFPLVSWRRIMNAYPHSNSVAGAKRVLERAPVASISARIRGTRTLPRQPNPLAPIVHHRAHGDHRDRISKDFCAIQSKTNRTPEAVKCRISTPFSAIVSVLSVCSVVESSGPNDAANSDCSPQRPRRPQRQNQQGFLC